MARTKTKKLLVYLAPKLHDKLLARKVRTGLSMNRQINIAVEMFLKKQMTFDVVDKE
jgi:hypothetical protein